MNSSHRHCVSDCKIWICGSTKCFLKMKMSSTNLHTAKEIYLPNFSLTLLWTKILLVYTQPILVLPLTLHHRKRLSFSPNYAKLLDLFLILTRMSFLKSCFSVCNLVKTILFWVLFLRLLFKATLGLDLTLPLLVQCSPLLLSAGPKTEIKNQNTCKTAYPHTSLIRDGFF